MISTRTLLCVLNFPEDLYTLETALSTDFSIENVSDPFVALRKVTNNYQIKAVVVDEELLHMPALEFLEMLQRLRPSVFRIVLTSDMHTLSSDLIHASQMQIMRPVKATHVSGLESQIDHHFYTSSFKTEKDIQPLS